MAVWTNSSTAIITGLALILAPLSACTTNVAEVCQVGGARCTVDGEFEYIVVGSGAGGGPLASRLARAGKRVLLLEAGQDVGGNTKYSVPAMHALATEDPALAWWFFVKHHSDGAIDRTDSKWTNEGILYPRGSALGGSTAVNAMVTVLPARSDWNRLAELTGDPSWRAARMDGYYDRVREWLSIELPDPALGLGDRTISGFLTAAALAHSERETGKVAGAATLSSTLSALLQRDVNESLRSGEATGLYRLPLATRSGRRASTRDFIQATVDEGYPLTVKTGAFVTRVLWDDRTNPPTARGVEYVRASSVYEASLSPSPAPADRVHAVATREVILSAGVFNTPQLLMLSGVGRAADLEAAAIPRRVDLPGVGQNLQDRYEAPIVSEFDAPIDLIRDCKLGESLDGRTDPCLADWENGRGVYQTPGFLASVLMKSSQSTALADLQVFAVPSDARGYYPGYSRDSAAAKNRFTWLLLKAHANNRDGEVRLSDGNPFSRPQIHFRSYAESDPANDPDLRALVEGVRFVRSILERYPLEPSPQEVWPGEQKQTDAELAAWIRKESWGHHACCTSKMGTADDPTAVVDSRFRVIGARNLRVVDASVFPEIPGTFIALPTMMVAERAADVILEDAR